MFGNHSRILNARMVQSVESVWTVLYQKKVYLSNLMDKQAHRLNLICENLLQGALKMNMTLITLSIIFQFYFFSLRNICVLHSSCASISTGQYIFILWYSPYLNCVPILRALLNIELHTRKSANDKITFKLNPVNFSYKEQSKLTILNIYNILFILLFFFSSIFFLLLTFLFSKCSSIVFLNVVIQKLYFFILSTARSI